VSDYLERASIARALKLAVTAARQRIAGPDRDGRAAEGAQDALRPALIKDPVAWRFG
jgi:hypothetical protein